MNQRTGQGNVGLCLSDTELSPERYWHGPIFQEFLHEGGQWREPSFSRCRGIKSQLDSVHELQLLKTDDS